MNLQQRPPGLRTARDVIEALNGLPVPAYVFDMKSLRFLAANRHFVQFLGYNEMELREMTIEQIRPESDVQPLHSRLKRRHQRGCYRVST